MYTSLALLAPLIFSTGIEAGLITRPRQIGRAAIPQCVQNIQELSCLNLVANCINTVTPSNVNNLWSIKSCVAAATCNGVGNTITAVMCQTGLRTSNAAQLSLDYDNVYAPIVGSCAFDPNGCPITQQNYIDFYYGTLSAINTANFPVSNEVVIAYWQVINAWTATGPTIPYLNFNDWLHFSTFPIMPPVPTSTVIASSVPVSTSTITLTASTSTVTASTVTASTATPSTVSASTATPSTVTASTATATTVTVSVPLTLPPRAR